MPSTFGECKQLGQTPTFFPAKDTFGHTYMPVMGRIVTAAGSDFQGNFAKDVWFSESQGLRPVGTCWSKGGGDIDDSSVIVGFNGPALVVVTLGAVEVLVFAGGQRQQTGGGFAQLSDSVYCSHDGGVTWIKVNNIVPMWPGRDNFAMVFNPMNKELAVLGGVDATVAPWNGNDFWSADVFTLFTDDTVRPRRRYLLRCLSPRII